MLAKEGGGVGLVQSVYDSPGMAAQWQLLRHWARLLQEEAAILLQALAHAVDVAALSYAPWVASAAPELAQLHHAMPASAAADHPIALHASLVVVPMAPAEVHRLQSANREHGAAATAGKVRDGGLEGDGLAGGAKVAQVERRGGVEAGEDPEQAGHKDEGVVVHHHHPAEAAAPNGRRALHVHEGGHVAVLRAKRLGAVRRAKEVGPQLTRA